MTSSHSSKDPLRPPVSGGQFAGAVVAFSFQFVTYSPPGTGASTPKGGEGVDDLFFRTLHAASLLPKRVERSFPFIRLVLRFTFALIHPLRALRSSPCLRGQRGSSEEALDVLLCPLRGAISIATLGGWLARWSLSVCKVSSPLSAFSFTFYVFRFIHQFII